MATISSSDANQISNLTDSIRSQASTASNLEAAAQTLVESTYRAFEDSSVLVRLYVTVPFSELPDFNANFVRNLAQSTGVSQELKDDTQVLSLLGTFGKEEKWRDRMQSQGHVGIPLVSAKFVGEIPMISRLLQQIGVGLDWVDPQDIKIVAKDPEKLSGMFYLKDAAVETDSKGRKVIPMQDFVSQYGVKTVFGFARGYDTGAMAVLVVFAGEEIDKNKANSFETLATAFQAATASQVTESRIFR